FSSRRRHTRFSRDWSSDVCSSDLLGTEQGVKSDIKTICFEEDNMLLLCSDGLSNKVTEQQMLATLNMEAELGTKADTLIELANRSEERRVGKECSCRWSECH